MSIYLICVLLVSLCNIDKPVKNTVVIDFNKELGEFTPIGSYMNNSIRYSPPPELARLIQEQFGKPKIMRCWLTLDDMWDYRTNKYCYNFQLGLDTYKNDTVKHKYDRDRVSETPYLYEDYLKAFSENSESILLNIRRYEHEVVNGIITIDKWKEIVKKGLKHYKEICPNMEYIEVLNESQYEHFGGLNDQEYYIFYKAAYEVINQLNNELSPIIPLKIGGPATCGKSLNLTNPKSNVFDPENKGQHIYQFLKNYLLDENENKKLDFISFHEYEITENPIILNSYENIIDSFLAEFNLCKDIPIFLDEIGYGHPNSDPINNLKQACGISTFYYYSRNSKNLHIFPWVTYHHPKQRSLVMFDGDLKLTPFGMAVKMMNYHKSREVSISTNLADMNGKGLHIIATKNERSAAIQLWNYQNRADTITILLTNLPSEWKSRNVTISEFIIDTSHNNNLIGKGGSEILSASNSWSLKGRRINDIEVILEPYSLYMYHLEEK